MNVKFLILVFVWRLRRFALLGFYVNVFQGDDVSGEQCTLKRFRKKDICTVLATIFKKEVFIYLRESESLRAGGEVWWGR